MCWQTGFWVYSHNIFIKRYQKIQQSKQAEWSHTDQGDVGIVSAESLSEPGRRNIPNSAKILASSIISAEAFIAVIVWVTGLQAEAVALSMSQTYFTLTVEAGQINLNLLNSPDKFYSELKHVAVSRADSCPCSC